MTSDQKKYDHVEVTGEGILPVIKAVSAEALCNVLLKKAGLGDVQKGGFYPMGRYLSLLQDMETRMPSVLNKIGVFIMIEAIFPPDIDSFEKALMLLDQAYHMNHKGVKGDEIGHYNYEKTSEAAYLISVNCPYPCIFDQGIISGMAGKFDTDISIEHRNDVCRRKGDLQCDYLVSVNL